MRTWLTEAVLQVVTQLYEELHRAAGEAPKFEPNSRLESHLCPPQSVQIELLLLSGAQASAHGSRTKL